MVNPRFLVRGGSDPVELRGTAKYGSIHVLDKWGKYSCKIYPDQPSMAKVHKLISEGIKNKLVQDEDNYGITFSRPVTIKTKKHGEKELDPVEVVDAFDNPLTDRVIPDGADITMTLETYGGPNPSGFGLYKAARLQKIKVH